MAVNPLTSNILGNTTINPLRGIFPNMLDNALKGFDSVTYKFSLGSVTNEEYASAAYVSSSTEIRSLVIGESGYTGNIATSVAASTGAAVPNVGNRAVTRYGVPEYFIDNVEFKHYLPSSRAINTGLASLKFDVTEPYSMGLFFDSLMVAAFNKNHKHFNDDCPWILKIDYIGWKDGKSSKLPPKWIPLRFRNIEFTANEAGSQYAVEMYEYATGVTTSNVVSAVPTSANFPMDEESVQNTFNAFAQTFNDYFAARAGTGQEGTADQYRIVLGNMSDVRTTGTLSAISNPPGWDNMTFDVTTSDPGNRGYVNPDDYDPQGVNIRLNVGGRQFAYNGSAEGAETTIFTVIDDIMCHTSYAKTSQEPGNIQEGYMWWWAIHTNVTVESWVEDSVQGRRRSTYTYTVVPYRVRVDQLRAPTVAITDGPVSRERIRKVFSYLYTGRNDDIISYNMNFNNMFYLATNPVNWQDMRDAADSATIGTEELYPNRPGADAAAVTDMASATRAYADQNAFPSIPGGAGVESPAIQINRFLNGVITGGRNRAGQNSNNEMVQLSLQLKITGDPYFIPVGGLGSQTESNDLNSMAWEGEQVRVYVRFRSIIDAPQDGNSLYVQKLNGQKDHPFSGLYRLMRVDSFFNGGEFTQKLYLYRDMTIDPSTSNVFNAAAVANAEVTNPLFVGDAQEVPAQASGTPTPNTNEDSE